MFKKGQLASLLNSQAGIRETAVVMETTDLENKPIMIAMQRRRAEPVLNTMVTKRRRWHWVR
jgi:hypothetical protein